MNDRFTALADALRKHADELTISDKANGVCREAAALIRGLSVVEPCGFLVDGEYFSDRKGADGYAWLMSPTKGLSLPVTPLYLHSAPTLLDPPQAPAEGVERDAARYRWPRDVDYTPYGSSEPRNAARDDIEIRLNDDGTLDEVVAPRLHLEQMSDQHWWMAVYDGDPRTAGRVTVNFHARGKIKAYVERESRGEQETSGKTGEAPK